MAQSFVAMNKLEEVLIQAKTGLVPISALMGVLVAYDIVVPSGSEVLADGTGFRPIVFTREKNQMVACFTDKIRIGEFSKMASYCLVMKGIDFMRSIPSGHGVVVNPGQEVGFDISSDGLVKVLNDFSM